MTAPDPVQIRFPSADRRRLGERLLARGLVTPADVQNALALQAQNGGLIGLNLVRLGALSETSLLEALSEQLGLAVLAPEDAPAPDRIAAFLSEIGSPVSWWAEREAVAWRDGDAPDSPILCAAVQPLDTLLAERIGQATDQPVTFLLAQRSTIEGLTGDLTHQGRAGLEMDIMGGGADAARLRELAQEAPTIDFVNAVFAEALARRASDVHVEPFEDRFLVRMRIDGVLSTSRTAPRSAYDAVCSRIKLLSGMDIGERRLPQDGRQTIRVSGQEVDLRVSTLPASWGESIVLRLLGKTSRLPELSELGVSAAQEKSLLELSEQPNGVLLVTGPTGSGKTTTIYRLLTHLNDGERKIITVEDPVELDLPGVVQVRVRSEIGLTFAAGLRSILRQDPDVIMVGEIRDPETARIAVQAALTGHLVISTVHTNSALAAIPRLLDLGIEDYLLADVIRGVQGQRLVRRLCVDCKRPSTPEEAAVHEADLPASLRKQVKGQPANWHEPVGCPKCGQSGFRGRIGVYEIAPMSPALTAGLRQGADEDRLTEIARADGFLSFGDDAFLKARRGETALTEVHRIVGGGGETP
ncbi:MAG: Flp pilus assembly complex ATPase component TadA [Brevundimonas sp.]|uniref:GspE/PulE family protein n=1 Tax=Brevundimonas sp. TaxID=1871086 RepID=UPI0025B7E9A6|nr:type II/IV secretion system protein [Brevundimonas sp.]MBX3478326.1 Flp pilus assembly complex ATPase component TadA [Brevundimonas sp.]